MIREAAIKGAATAAARFGIREASLWQTLLGTVGAGVGGGMVRGAINAASPNLMNNIENLGAAPVNAIKRVLRPGPADILAKTLENAHPLPPPPVRIV